MPVARAGAWGESLGNLTLQIGRTTMDVLDDGSLLTCLNVTVGPLA
jgi:hypothetical protein